ncbi:helix-turn-helix transcriptional regulator [Vagococcus coleopterorum]|uniref:Helix-turn-helix transcriptional regulator n=2 Tax=Vagococcus coleopterorum TaxID=2714946 RepID=A0A6G8ALC9_9ENTE|nr:helix-turn-helix transcriptional regulator [Vagococcus coleopterorum]
MKEDIIYGGVVKQIREKRQLSQAELAEGICSQSMLSRIEHNLLVPNINVIRQLCERLTITMDEVINQTTTNSWLGFMRECSESNRHEDLQLLVKETAKSIGIIFPSKIERQEYLYYKGTCELILNRDNQLALNSFQESLNCTYSSDKEAVTDMEILLLSVIGKIYYEEGQGSIGLSFMEKALERFYVGINKREEIELPYIFANLGMSMIEEGNPKRALEILEEGILWNKKKQRFFCMSKLYLFKGLALNDLGQIDESIDAVKMSESLALLEADLSF